MENQGFQLQLSTILEGSIEDSTSSTNERVRTPKSSSVNLSDSSTLNISKSKSTTPLCENDLGMGKYFVNVRSRKPCSNDLEETLKIELPTKENVEPKKQVLDMTDMEWFLRDSAKVSAQNSLKEDRYAGSTRLDASFFTRSRSNTKEKCPKLSNDLKMMEIDNRGSIPPSNKPESKKHTPAPAHFPDFSFVSHRSITPSHPVKIQPKEIVSTSTSTSMIQTINQQQSQPQPQVVQIQQLQQAAVPSTPTSNQGQRTFQGTPVVSVYLVNPPNYVPPIDIYIHFQ